MSDEINEIIKIALDKHSKIGFRYVKETGEITNRTVQPLAIFRYENIRGETFTYFTGYCELRLDYRTFRLDRMSEITLLNETFCVEPLDIRSLLNRPEDEFTGFNLWRVKILKCAQGLATAQEPAKPSSIKEKTYGTPSDEVIEVIEKPGYEGGKRYPKLWYSKKLFKSPVWCRSTLEEEIFSCLDEDERVLWYQVEPFKIFYWAGRERRSYTPDLLVSYKSGRRVIVEIKAEQDVRASCNQAKFRAIEEYAKENRYDFEVWTNREMIPATWKDEGARSVSVIGQTTLEKETVLQRDNMGCLTLIVLLCLIYFVLMFLLK